MIEWLTEAHLRGLARRGVTDAAIQTGAYGGSRHGVAEGVHLGELDRAQTQQIGGLLSQGFQSALQTGLQRSDYERSVRQQMLMDPVVRRQELVNDLLAAIAGTGATLDMRSGEPVVTLAR